MIYGSRATLVGLCVLITSIAVVTAAFTPLVAIPPPRVESSSPAFPGGKYETQHLFDQNTKTEYASRSFGTNTFVECDFGTSVEIAAFRHLDRDDPATIIESELAFLDSAGAVVRTLAVKHTNTRGGETFLLLTNPVTAQRVRWRVTKITSRIFNAVGGAEMGFFRTELREPRPKRHTILGSREKPAPSALVGQPSSSL